jgi:hypothetical protein
MNTGGTDASERRRPVSEAQTLRITFHLVRPWVVTALTSLQCRVHNHRERVEFHQEPRPTSIDRRPGAF